MAQTRKIVFAGGPGTGKTATLKALKKAGWCCLEEISRQVTLEAQKEGISQLFLKDPLLFSQRLLDGRIQQFLKADQISSEICFFDRGIPEVSAYMLYKKEPIPPEFKKADKTFRYDMVFLFPIWDSIYQSDNERYENVEEAREIQEFIKKAYESLGYELIHVPRESVTKRVDFIENTVKYARSK